MFLNTVAYPLHGIFFSFVPSCSLMLTQKIITAKRNKDGRLERKKGERGGWREGRREGRKRELHREEEEEMTRLFLVEMKVLDFGGLR